MKNLNITTGEWKISQVGNVITDEPQMDGGDLICEAPVQWESSIKRWEGNSQLIADAGTTYNQCEMLPSELLEAFTLQREALYNLLKMMESEGNTKSPLYIQTKLTLEKFNPKQ